MKPREVAEFIKTAVNSLDMPAIHLWGPPGIGKSQVCQQVAEKQKIGFIDMRLSMKDPTDIKGLPTPENGRARWLPPSELPREGRGILLLDELNLAPPLVQASAYQLILDRKAGEYSLPSGWQIIAAGNKAEHGANIFKMAPPLRNRFIHVDFELDLDDWREYALRNNFATEVVEFISFRTELLFAFDEKKNENAFPTPRSWEFVSRVIKNSNGIGTDLRHKIIEGTIGVGAASEFKAYLKLKDGLPSIEEILAGKDHLVQGVDLSYAVATALVIRAKTSQFERLLQYSEKINFIEVAALMIKLMAAKDKQALLLCPSWKLLSKKYFDLMCT